MPAVRASPLGPQSWACVPATWPTRCRSIFFFQAGDGIRDCHVTGVQTCALPIFLGDAVARHWSTSRAVRGWIAGTAGFVLLGCSLFASEVRFDWLPAVIGDFRLGKDPSLDVVDWTSLRDDLIERGLLDRPRLLVATLRWSDAGKIDYALGGRLPVICLGPDAHQYGLVARADDHAGADVLIVTRVPFEKIVGQYWLLFDAIEPIAPATVL